MPQDQHWSIQGFKHHSWALGSSQQRKLKISNVLLCKPVFLNQENKESRDNSYGKELKAFLAVSQASCCGFCPFLWHDWRGACCLTCMWPSLSHTIKLTQASLLRTLADTVPSQDFWWKKPREKTAGVPSATAPSLHRSEQSWEEGRGKQGASWMNSPGRKALGTTVCHVTYIKVHHMIISIKSMVYVAPREMCYFRIFPPHPERLTACSKAHRL